MGLRGGQAHRGKVFTCGAPAKHWSEIDSFETCKQSKSIDTPVASPLHTQRGRLIGLCDRAGIASMESLPFFF